MLMNETAQPLQKVRPDAPCAVGDWIADSPGTTHPDIARVLAVYWDQIAGEWVGDVRLYRPTGTRIGRRSPAMGGPTDFEPCVPLSAWHKIRRPEFPLTTDMSGFRCWGPYLEYLSAFDATQMESAA